MTKTKRFQLALSLALVLILLFVTPMSAFAYTQADGDFVYSQSATTIPTTGGTVTLTASLQADVPYQAATCSIDISEAIAAGATVTSITYPVATNGWVTLPGNFQGNSSKPSVVATWPQTTPQTNTEQIAVMVVTLSFPSGLTDGTVIKVYGNRNMGAYAGQNDPYFSQGSVSDYVDGDRAVFTINVADPTDFSALVTAISNANTAKSSAAAMPDGTDPATVLQGTTFVDQTDANTLAAAITAAQSVRNNASATPGEVNAAVTTLNTAIGVFNASIKTGTRVPTDYSLLVTAIGNANTAKSSATAMADGTDPATVTSGQKFVDQTDADALIAAIADANTVNSNPNATQADVDAAVIAMNDATDIFNAAIKLGTKAAATSGGSDTATSSTSTSTSTAPKTGDSNNIALYSILLVAAIGTAVTFALRKKEQ